MSIPFKKYGYELNPITDEYKTPQIYLADKQIRRIGQLYPVENLKITINEINQADEVSFTYHRSTNGEDAPLFDKLDDLSIILVEGYGYFEIAIDKNEHSTVTKSVTGISLGHAELSQILTTLEINTDDDMARPDYDDGYPTVFFRSLDEIYDEEITKKCRESSLLHRILSCAPHYRIGSVSPSLCPIQRTFSWSDTDILSILNDISKEINCAFDIQIYNEDGKPQRVLNVYDMQYCDSCFNQRDVSGNLSSNTYKYRTIIDGVCQNCNSSAHVKDIGDVTNIFISTENLSEDISIRGDKDNIKNCFKVVGGDDIITNTLNGLNMSASNRIMMFSDTQKREMSPELSDALDNYDKNYKDKLPEYEKLLETEYNIFDIKHYLRSAKMPSLEKENLTTDAALAVVIQKITEYYDKKFYISSYENYGYVSARTSIQNTFTTFMPEGYSFTMDYDSMTEKTKDYDSATAYRWYGTIRIYSTGNRDDSYTIHFQPSEDTYVTCGTNTEKYTFTDPDVQGIINSFSILFVFADQSQTEYIDYIEQHTKYILSTVDLSYENEKKRPWNLYSYNRLKSFYDGYQTCIETLDEMDRAETTGSKTDLLLKDMTTNYQAIQKDILSQMNVLLDQIFAICSYHGEYDADFIDAGGKVNYTLQYYNDIPAIYDHITDPAYTGGYQNEAYKVNEFIGTKPFQCKKCGSSNVVESTNGNLCRNSHCNGSGTDIYTYLDIMKNICDSYKENPGETITGMRNACQSQFDMSNYLTDEQYAELRSFIREDVYTNSNYTSDGLNNSQIIEHAKELMAKARQELAKACNTQYTINTSLASVVAQKPFLYHGVTVNDDYAGFKINNFVWVRIDGKIYKMRIASMEFTFPVSDRIEVTFTNVTDYKSSTSDIKEILDKAGSMATSYRYVATQAEKGAVANAQLDTIKQEGLDAGLMAVKAGRDQDIVIDNHGILLRKKIEETNDYSQYQMKLINRNIVMTYDNWETARMAIGLGSYTVNGKKELVYGIWADLLCGDLIVGKEMIIKNNEDDKKSSVRIDGDGIQITNGEINMYNENSGVRVKIDPSEEAVFEVSKDNKTILGFNQDGDAFFNGKVNATGIFGGEVNADSGNIGGWEINEHGISKKDLCYTASITTDKLYNAPGLHIASNTECVEDNNFTWASFDGTVWGYKSRGAGRYLCADPDGLGFVVVAEMSNLDCNKRRVSIDVNNIMIQETTTDRMQITNSGIYIANKRAVYHDSDGMHFGNSTEDIYLGDLKVGDIERKINNMGKGIDDMRSDFQEENQELSKKITNIGKDINMIKDWINHQEDQELSEKISNMEEDINMIKNWINHQENQGR